ncbi:hypothetical protein EDD15DRAFT_2523172 [Pisolithus albus]|nr:hypothetical protein EDD15DRAFT_2523172 [Pisolithus albus]
MSRQRPLSAIYIGPSSSSLQLQHPPPSPGSNTSGGLPSPPATNSTGSGSTTEDSGAGSTHQCPAPNVVMDYHHNDKLTLSDDDDDNDDDNTARLDRKHPSKITGEALGTLQRVKSLAQRNRMAIDKLTSFSRLNTPSPSGSSRLSRSPGCNPLASASTSSLTSTSHHSHPASMSASDRRRADTLSGSETERESFRAPTPSHSTPSAPSSPDKARQASPGPSRTPRKRTSLASTTSAPVGPLDADRERYRYHAHERSNANENDITDAALAAVASARQSPIDTATAGTSSRRSRQPLPREFRDGIRRSLDGQTSIEPPRTPYSTRAREGTLDQDENADVSPRTALHTAANAGTTRLQFSPRSAARLNRAPQLRWQSDDFSTNGVGDTPSTTATAGAPIVGTGRRQTLRGGSAESPLTSGRLASESLRAAGIGTRSVRSPFLAGPASSAANGSSANSKDDDPFLGTDAGVLHRSRSRTGKSVEWEDREYDRHQGYQDHYEQERDTRRRMLPEDQRSRTSASSNTRLNEGPVLLLFVFIKVRDGEFEACDVNGDDRGLERGIARKHGSRGELERSRSATLRRHTSVMTPSHSYTHSSPYPRQDLHQRGTSQQAEHARLLSESLTMLLATLSKLPIQTGVGRDLGYQAETIVRASERLNGLLRAGTTHAVQRQIAIEVDEDVDPSREGRESGGDMAKLWRDVGADFREGLRESDEVVRTLTGFILGVGKVLKEMASIASASIPGGGGSAASATNGTGSACGSTASIGEGKEHLRSVSLDHHDIVRRYVRTPDSGSGGARLVDGRRSVESRRSWDPTGVSEYEPPSSRPPSSAMRERERDGGGSDLERRGVPRAPASASSSSALGSTSSPGLELPSTTRRLMTPREIREQQSVSLARTPGMGVGNLSSTNYEPLPTPASRQQFGKGMPPPLLSHFKQQSTPGPSQSTCGGRHLQMSSTTLLTRSDSRDSRESSRASVTFSRPSEVSTSALQMQQSRDDARRRGEEELIREREAEIRQSLRSPLSGSETERDTRRRTIGSRVARMSLDAAIDEREGEFAGGSGGVGPGGTRTSTITLPSQRRERRRTVTEIFGRA